MQNCLTSLIMNLHSKVSVSMQPYVLGYPALVILNVFTMFLAPHDCKMVHGKSGVGGG